MPAPLSLIAAVASNRVIGRQGRLVFRSAEDRAWLERHTAGKTLLLGRNCYQAWPGAGAERRRPIVLTSHPEGIAQLPQPPGVTAPLTAPNVPAALALARDLPGEIMVCGGQRIYEETLPLADRLYLTLVEAEPEGDRWFPEWRQLSWQETFRQEAAERGVRYTFQILERVR